MREAIERFRANLTRTRTLGSIVAALSSRTTADLADVLRAELVLSVSALDHYVHEVVRLGMLESYRGERPRTTQFQGFQISLGRALDALALSGSADDNWINDEIRARHSFRSFQTPNNIASAIRLISDVALWSRVAQRMGTPADDLTERLRAIIDRRNKIAHEADMSPPPHEDDRLEIDRRMVSDAVDFLEQLVEAIHEIIR